MMRKLLYISALILLATLSPAIAQAQFYIEVSTHMSNNEEQIPEFISMGRAPYINTQSYHNIHAAAAHYTRLMHAGRYDEALACCDSLISTLQHNTINSRFSTIHYQNRAFALRALKRYAEAYEAYQQALHVHDSMSRIDQMETVTEMQVAYEVDELHLGKIILSTQYHQIALISSIVLSLVSFGFIVFFFFNIRRTKHLQHELLNQMQHAQNSDSMKTAFINSMCHEVRTPLNCIVGFAELMIAEDTEATREEYRDIVRNNCRYLQYMFNDLLEVAYLENLQRPLPTEYIDVHTVCNSLMSELIDKHAHTGIHYTTDLSTAKLGIHTNDKYFKMLLSALLNNANKFTTKGSIHLACSQIVDNGVMITLTDTGPGIPIDKQEYVFERFTKIDSFSQGNGLGLYLCKLIIKLLHGQIHIDPKYTHGTKVIITLPEHY
ncbi:MAG: HAMP domain-containing sensor histidine kinase [Alistipes sp.]